MKKTILLFLLVLITAVFGYSKYAKTEPIKMIEDKNDFPGEKSFSEKFMYLALGDSYTIGEGVETEERFPMQLAAKLNAGSINALHHQIVAQTGWTTDELQAGIEKANIQGNYDLVTLLIGVNNQYRGRDTAVYRQEFTEILQKSIDFAGGNPRNVIVISIPDYGITPFAKDRNPGKISAEINTFNKINREETQNRGSHYIDITTISRMVKKNPDLLAEDDLHPSGEMYRLWVEAIFPVARQILEEN